MRDLTVIDFIIFGTAFFSGILAHEGSHLLVLHAIGDLKPQFNPWKLQVISKPPKTDLQKRLVGLAPVILFIIVGCFEIMYQVTSESPFFGKVIATPVFLPVFVTQHFRFVTLLFMLGLIIGLSSSDISLKVQESGGSWKLWQNAPVGLKIAIGGGILALINVYIKQIPASLLEQGKDVLFLQVLTGLFEVCVIAVLLIAIGFHITGYRNH